MHAFAHVGCLLKACDPDIPGLAHCSSCSRPLLYGRYLICHYWHQNVPDIQRQLSITAAGRSVIVETHPTSPKVISWHSCRCKFQSGCTIVADVQSSSFRTMAALRGSWGVPISLLKPSFTLLKNDIITMATTTEAMLLGKRNAENDMRNAVL